MNIKSSARVKLHVFKYVNLILWKENIRENSFGYWGEAALSSRIWGAKENYFRELRNFLSGIWGDQCIIFRDLGSTDPLGPHYLKFVI